MSISIQLYNCSSEPNAIEKNLDAIGDPLVGVFRDATSVLNPSIDIESNQINANYMHIGSPVNRWYFIDEIIAVRTNLVTIKGHVDVLQTYKEDILNVKGIVRRNAEEFTKYIVDEKITASAKREILTTKFSNDLDDENIILVVANV